MSDKMKEGKRGKDGYDDTERQHIYKRGKAQTHTKKANQQTNERQERKVTTIEHIDCDVANTWRRKEMKSEFVFVSQNWVTKNWKCMTVEKYTK